VKALPGASLERAATGKDKFERQVRKAQGGQDSTITKLDHY
jgi:hypothetical protein